MSSTLHRLAFILPVAMLTACGGGGGGGNETPAPAGPLAAYAGVYHGTPAGGTSEILVHPQGQVAISWQESLDPSGTGTRHRVDIAGSFSPSGNVAQAPGADLYATTATWSGYVQQTSSTTRGTADATLTRPDAAGSVTAMITNASVATPVTAIAATREAVSSAFLGLPLAKLGGDYVDAETLPARFQNVHVDATTGAVTGDYVSNCQVTGSISGYDNSVGMFLLDAAFSGTGCANVVPTGSGRFVGYLKSSRFGHIELVASGIVAGQPASLMLMHSQVLGNY